MSALFDAIKATWITETLENYPVACRTESDKRPDYINQQRHRIIYNIYDDMEFWLDILRNPDRNWEAEFNIHECIYTEWIARVPGLFWASNSLVTRKLAEKFQLIDPFSFGDISHIYQPVGKSAHVSGGIGTLKLPSDDRWLFRCDHARYIGQTVPL